MFFEPLRHRVEQVLKKSKRACFVGEGVQEHDETSAEAWIVKGMKKLGLRDEELIDLKMNCPEKYALAWLARRNTCVRTGWIKDRLHMGTATCFAGFLKQMETARKGRMGICRVAAYNRRMRNRMSGGVGAGAGPPWASSGHPILCSDLRNTEVFADLVCQLIYDFSVPWN